MISNRNGHPLFLCYLFFEHLLAILDFLSTLIIFSFLKNFGELNEKSQRLEAENLKLVSHQNLNQKIKHHLNLKKENNQLKEVILSIPF